MTDEELPDNYFQEERKVQHFAHEMYLEWVRMKRCRHDDYLDWVRNTALDLFADQYENDHVLASRVLAYNWGNRYILFGQFDGHYNPHGEIMEDSKLVQEFIAQAWQVWYHLPAHRFTFDNWKKEVWLQLYKPAL